MISEKNERHFLDGAIIGAGIMAVLALTVSAVPRQTASAGDCEPQEYVIARDAERGNCMYIVDRDTGEQIQIGNTGGSQWCGR